ncbi:MAG: hypothetical protein ABSB89_02080 [Candidatus Bathyarchaeia archaeon]
MKTAEKVEVTPERMERIRDAITGFKDSVVGQLKDLHAEVKDWRFAVESHEEGITVDVSVKVLIKPKAKK